MNPTDRRLVLDPRTTILLLLAANVAVLTRFDDVVHWATVALGAALLASARRAPLAGAYVALALACRATTLAADAGALGAGLAAAGVFLGNATTVAGFGAYLVLATPPGDLIAALTRLRLPDTLVIPLAVVVRFVPVVLQELAAIAAARRLRPAAGLRNPVTVLEDTVVPLIAISVRLGEDLAASALVRGLGGPQRRTSIARLGPTLHDLLGVGAAAALLVLHTWRVS